MDVIRWAYGSLLSVCLVSALSIGAAEAASRPGEVWIEPVTGMEFVWISGGCYEMGCVSLSNECWSDEYPVHEVCVDGFWIGRYEVTNAQYKQYEGGHDTGVEGVVSLNGADQPVGSVDWSDAKAFAAWLEDENGNRYDFRLPTEAEWEYACRAGTKTSRFWGSNPDDACEYANAYDQTACYPSCWIKDHHNCTDEHKAASKVGSFRPNGFGLYDMLGNVWEWCEDKWASDAYSIHERNNPVIRSGESSRVCRGGSWVHPPHTVRCAYREFFFSNDRYTDLGFRLVRIHKGLPDVNSVTGNVSPFDQNGD